MNKITPAKPWIINLMFFMLLIMSYLTLDDRTDNFVSLDYESFNIGQPFEHKKRDILNFYKKLNSSERKVYSRNGEDGIIGEIFRILNITDINKNLVELGVGNGDECNTRYLREYKNWTGVQFDKEYEKPEINLHKELIHHNNALDILNKYNIPIDIDLLSVDTDFADYWITEKILTKYKPKVVIHEINQQSPHKCVSVPKIDEIVIHDGSNFHGANICAFYCLAISNDYSMVYCESTGINCFWIKNDLIQNNLKFDINNLQKLLNPDFLYRNAALTQTEETDKKWFDIQKCF